MSQDYYDGDDEPCEHKKEEGESRCEWCGCSCIVDEDGHVEWLDEE
jgi:hypothetical protein